MKHFIQGAENYSTICNIWQDEEYQSPDCSDEIDDKIKNARESQEEEKGKGDKARDVDFKWWKFDDPQTYFCVST